MFNLKVSNPVLKNWDNIRFWVEFDMNGQQFKIETTWNEGKCSFEDVIAHRGYSGETTVPVCSYCGKSFVDCEVCPEFYFNSVKTQIIANQLVSHMHEQLKELPFNFEIPFIRNNRGQKVADMIKVAHKRGDKITGIFDDYERYMVSGSAVAPSYNDPELLEEDNMFFMKTKYRVVNVADGSEKEVTGEVGIFDSDHLYSYLIPNEMLDNSNPFVELEVAWKREMVLDTLPYLDDHRRNSAALFLRSMLERNFPKATISKFLEEWVSVDMLEDSTAITSQFIALMEDEHK